MIEHTTLLHTLGHLGIITLGMLTGVGLFFILLKLSKILTKVIKSLGLATFMGVMVASFTPMALEAYGEESPKTTLELKDTTTKAPF